MTIATVEILKLLPFLMGWAFPYDLIAIGCLAVGFFMEWTAFGQGHGRLYLVPVAVFFALVVFFEWLVQIDSGFSGLLWMVFLTLSLLLFLGSVMGAAGRWLMRWIQNRRPR